MGPSNQIVRRTSSSWAPPCDTLGFRIGGRISIIGMNVMMLNIPTTANSSDTRERGRRQWLLVNRNATAAIGAALVIMKMYEKVAM